jgi:hypothetical protein
LLKLSSSATARVLFLLTVWRALCFLAARRNFLAILNLRAARKREIARDGKNSPFFLEKKSTFFSLFLSKFSLFLSRFLSEKVAF